MIISFGFLSLLQLTILPGLIITRFFKLRGFWANFVIALGISPIINYLFVLITSLLGIYNRVITISFVVIEIILLFILLIPVFRNHPIQLGIKEKLAGFIHEYFSLQSGGHNWGKLLLNGLILAAAAGMLVFYIARYGTQYNSVFTTWDAVVSWNRWAMEWITYQTPLQTGHYPQLIPANLSLTYQLMGDMRVQFFAKAYMGYIEIFILFSMFFLAIKERRPGIFLGVIVTGLIQLKLGSQGSGYVDTPVSYWAFLSLLCLFILKTENEKGKYLLFGAVFAATSAVTKQAGLWMAVLYPVFVLLALKDGVQIETKNKFLKIFALEFVIIAPWYLYYEFLIWTKKGSSEIPYLLDLTTKGKSIWEIINGGLHNIASNLTNSLILSFIVMIFLVFLILLAMKEKEYRRISLLVTIPFFIIWTFAFSYDHRNINMIVPFVGITSGIGLEYILNFCEKKISNLCKKVYALSVVNRSIHSITTFFKSLHALYVIAPLIVIFIALGAILFIALPQKYSNDYLITKSIAQQKLMGDNHLNQLLYEYKDDHGFDAKILTDYQYLNFLPEMEGLYVYAYPNDDYFLYQMENPEIGYVLVNVTNETDEIRMKIDAYLNTGKFSRLIDFGYYQLYSTCRGSCE